MKLLFGILLLSLLIAWSALKWYTPDAIVEWDPPLKFTDNSLISPGDELRYEVFIRTHNKIKAETLEYEKLLTPVPIKETSFKISKSEIKKAGHYDIGVRALLFKDGKHVKNRNSRIAWSSNKPDTYKKRLFGIYIEN